MPRAFTVGIVGAGAILPHHLEAIRATDAFSVVGVCDTDPARRTAAAGSIGCEGFADWRPLIDRRPDVLAVLLPHHLHATVALEALARGCHVVVEKPMAGSVAECRGMLAAARSAKRMLTVAETAAANPGAARTGERFRTGSLGAFLAGSIANVRFYFDAGRPAWFLDPVASGGGMFSNLGVHRLALARACLPGEVPAAVSATMARLPGDPVEACTAALVRYRAGGSMLYEEVGTVPRPSWLAAGIHLVFERGIAGWDESAWRLQGRDDAREEPLPPAGPVYAPLYGALAAALRGEGPAPSAEGNALDVAVVRAAYESARDSNEVRVDAEGFSA
jgi:phthalate 4,5-cis-dihydrodiol dehydrogenase